MLIKVDPNPELDADWAEARDLFDAIHSTVGVDTMTLEQAMTLGASCNNLVRMLADLHGRTQQHLFKNVGKQDE